jgi:hypothetical protein
MDVWIRSITGEGSGEWPRRVAANRRTGKISATPVPQLKCEIRLFKAQDFPGAV